MVAHAHDSLFPVLPPLLFMLLLPPLPLSL